MTRLLKLLTIFLALSLLGAGPAMAAKPIIVGGKNFTEQYILADMAKILLEKHGLSVETRTGVGSAIARRALLNGQIDLYYEYTGTAYTVYDHQSDPEIMRDPQKVYRWVKERDVSKGLIWLEPVKFNNTYTLMMRKAQAARLGIRSISDLAAYVSKHPEGLRFAVNTEFWERPDGFKKMMKHYGFRVPFGRIRKMSLGLTYMALKGGEVDVAMGFATDGRIAAFGFTTLLDDKDFFPVYNPAPVVRKATLERHPEIPEILQPIAERLDTQGMRSLNGAVDVRHQSAEQVAREWLREQGLL
ncbi:MAG: glycine betaine ABC transporter substrate-binding protein [Deltaproteobacteria bacterium]|jgi:osmoprotectant transport system substrate-binding protein